MNNKFLLLSLLSLLLSSSLRAADLDHDGFQDGTDSNPLSRAYIPCGSSQYLGTNDDIVYTWPDWMVSAQKAGGDWNTNLPAWVVSPSDTNEAALLIAFDRSLVTNDLTLKLDYLDTTNAVLAVELLLPPVGTNATNEVVTVSPNVLTGNGGVTNTTVSLSLIANTNAVGVRIRRGTGEIAVFSASLYIDQDGDGLDADQEAQLGTSDTALDSDQDGFSDYEEVFVYGSNPADSFSVPAAAVSGQILYFGTQSGIIHVLATTDTNSWSSPHYLTSLFPSPASVPLTSHATAFTLQNLPLRQTYSVRAYVDVNGNDLCDSWEPQGIAVPDITLTGTTNGIVVFLGDPDTDGDGLADAAELMLGLGPTVPDLAACLPYFAGFETNENFVAGLLNGQNGWTVTPAVTAMVQTNTVYAGAQAVLVDSGTSTSLVRRLISRASQLGSATLWLDYRAEVSAIGAFPAPTNAIASYAFDWKGRPVVWDGHLTGTNKWVTLTNTAAASLSGWTRLTVGLNFDEQSWLLCLNGVLVAQNLGFGMSASELHAFDMKAGCAGLDNFAVTTNTPAQLSLDGDSMPDDWEMQYFGNLNQTDSGDVDGDGVPNYAEYLTGTNPTNNDAGADADGDGLTNLQEYQHGTNPNAADSDHDGMPDAWEVAHGLDPILNDATADADEDGLTNLQEYQLGTNPQVADTDGDGMPDGWEVANEFNPLLASDAALDPDNDGLTNLQEYQNGTDPHNPDTDGDGLPDGIEVNTYHTRPYLADSDGDGMPDKWEIEHGFNPMAASDAAADFDGDGLSNLREYQAGTNPRMADTDGDGMTDYLEVEVFHSDPLHPDFDGTVTSWLAVKGGDSTGWIGAWAKEGDSVYALERSGCADYDLPVPSNGTYAVTVDVTQHNPLTTQDSFDLSVYLDGVLAGRQVVSAPFGTVKTAVYFPPALTAGSHSLRVQWKNREANTFLQINAIGLRVYGGPDSNANGIPDWIEARQERLSALEAMAQESIVSPVCVEGSAVFLDTLAVTPSYVPEGQTAQVVAAEHAIGNAWYANVQLSPEEPTDIVINDASAGTVRTNTVQWQAITLPDNAYTNGVMIRGGSSLRFCGAPTGATNGTVSLSIQNGAGEVVTNLTGGTEAIAYQFDQGGSFSVSSLYSNEETAVGGTMIVKVVTGGFNGREAVCVEGVSRTWSCPALPDDAIVGYDSRLTVVQSHDDSNKRVFTLLTPTDETLYMVARLGETGPVLDSAKISSVYGDHGTYFRVVESFADGSRMTEVRLQMGYVPADIKVYLHIFVGGVTFLDGTLDKVLTAADFNEIGVCTYRLLQSAESLTSICHTTEFYQGDVRIGGN